MRALPKEVEFHLKKGQRLTAESGIVALARPVTGRAVKYRYLASPPRTLTLLPLSFCPLSLPCQQCNGCSRYFCQQCISFGHSGGGGGGGESGARGEGSVEGMFGTALYGKKSPQFCRRCTVFSYRVMERRHLNELSVQELKGYQVWRKLSHLTFSNDDLRTRDTLGLIVLSLVERLSLSQR